MRFDDLYTHIIARLQKELPAQLSYHNARHTESVVAAATALGKKEGLGEEELTLLRSAALLHDTGFITAYKNHETASCEIAKTDLPQYGFTEKEVADICRLIMVTQMPQQPQTKAEQILCDADLHYLGTDEYAATAEKLFKEYKEEGIVSTRKQWQAMQVQFLNTHHYFTPTAIKEFSAKKEENKQMLLKGHKASHQPPSVKLILQDVFFMLAGVLVCGFGLKGFLLPNQFFDGGVTGLSLLLHELYDTNLAWTILLLNLPLLIAGYFSIGKSFALKTALCIVLLSVCIQWLPYPIVTSDKLLISIFGGVFIGIGIGLVMRAGCALDGIEVLALYTLKRSSFTITEIILGLNIIIFGVAALKFGMETALYSVLTYIVASRMIDYVVEGIQAFTGITIISAESETIKYRLVNELGRGITVYKGQRGFLPTSFEVSADVDIIFTVVTRLEMRKLKNVVYDVDPKAFVFANTIKEAAGGVLKRRQRH